MTVGLVRAKFAVLADHYHLTLDQIADLTDRQISEVYFHARTKEGAVEIPVPDVEVVEEPETEADVLLHLDLLRAANLIGDENYRQCVADARRKFGGEGEGRQP